MPAPPPDDATVPMRPRSEPSEPARDGHGTVTDTGYATDVTAGGKGGDATGRPLIGLAPESDLVGQHVDRYVVLSRLGAGGMGVVYAARDPALERKVALKVLPPLDDDHRGHLEARLRREAQALAKLDHPNVVAVYDVGVAEHSVFVAMQLVDGTTLEEHLRTAKPPPPRVLELFLAAGRGLAAAHAAGIVHRDFKPSNVLVDRAGRVYVGDFGLARAGDDRDEARADRARLTDSLLHESMTRDGAVMGTPLYMSPEQHRGELATERADQFAFCVSLWQALYGAHPFLTRLLGGRWNVTAAQAAMAQDAVAEPPRTRGVSSRVQRALRRGMRHDPAARWPSMDALLAELTPRSRTTWVWGGLFTAGVAGAVIATAALQSQPDPGAACRAGADRFALLWPTRADELRHAIESSGVPDGPGTADRVIAALDHYAAGWRAARLDTCSASDRGETTAALRDQRLRCLDVDLAVARDLVDDLGRAGRAQIGRAVDAVRGLPPIDDCAAANLAALPAPPAGALARVGDVRTTLERIHRMSDTGQADQAAPLAAQAVADATDIDYGPLLAQALLVQAHVALVRNAPDVIELAERAAEVATASRDDHTAAAAYTLALTASADQPDLPKADAILPIARGIVHRVDDPGLDARFASASAMTAIAEARYDDALPLCRQAVELGESHDDIDAIGLGYQCLTRAELMQGKVDDAAADAERQLADAEKEYGAGTRGTVDSLQTLATVRRRQDRFDDALDLLHRALQIEEVVNGEDSLEVATVLTSLATLMHEAQRTDEGLRYAERSIAIVDRAGAHGQVAIFAHVARAQLLRQAERRDDMRAEYERALALAEATLSPDDLNLATIRFSLAGALDEDNQVDRALSLYEQAGAAFHRAHNPREAVVAASRAEILSERGRCAEAVPIYESAVSLLEQTHADPRNLLIAQLHLGECLAESHGDLARAHALVVGVRDAAREAGAGDRPILDEASDWLKAHP